MALKCGIVGLPAVGKSALFDALTATASAHAKHGHSPVEPNLGQVPVPDDRLAVLAGLAESKEIIPTQLGFVDIAGLVAGASRGEGLGNRFLAHIREVDAIIQVVRCFENSQVAHVSGKIDPVADAATVDTELMIADLESLHRRKENLGKKLRGNDKEALALAALIDRIVVKLERGEPARDVHLDNESERKAARELQLLTSKPVLYVCNVDDASAASGNAWSKQMADFATKPGMGSVVIAAKIEAELAQLPADDRSAFLNDLGLHETGLSRVVKAGYQLLNLLTFFTVGPKETHAWPLGKGMHAPQAAGVIHSDFEKGFIRCETIHYGDFVACGGEHGAKEKGKMRMEGKNYVIEDGDVVHFHFA